MKVVDLRRVRSIIFNNKQFNNQSYYFSDKQIYESYQEKGDTFLMRLDGEFAFVYHDKKEAKVFAVRDWIGEMPLHFIVKNNSIYFANFITDLSKTVKNYSYEDVVALNRSEVLEIDLKKGNISKHLYYNFNKDSNKTNYKNLNKVADKVHKELFDSVRRRIKGNSKNTVILLSGGIDSMSIAYIVSTIDKNIPTYTLNIASQRPTDLIRAKEISKCFGLKHKTVDVTKEAVMKCVENSVFASEVYHMYNVFCAIGMYKLAKFLKRKNIKLVFTGEGGNEGFGDYHDWIVKDPKTGEEIVLQKTSKDFDTPAGREAYIWGNLKAEKLGRYNIQLGSGLGKHGGSRMYKPMFKEGLTLLSPYLDRKVMKIISNIPEKALKKTGGKPGFMSLVFRKEIKSGKIPKEFFEVKKIRFQDASEDGEGGITEELLKRGYNQERLIKIFNKIFKSKILERSHLKNTVLVK